MKSILAVFSCLALAAMAAPGHADGALPGAVSLGPSSQTVVVGGPGERFMDEETWYNHDGSFEDAFCFQAYGIDPNHGHFAEAFEAPSVPYTLMEVILWVTQIGDWTGQPLDLYVWQGGVAGEPGAVWQMEPGAQVVPGMWPVIQQNNLPMWGDLPPGDFTVGYWADFSATACGWYLAVDRNGGEGAPWVNVAAALGYGEGWQYPDEHVWPPSVKSFGIGVLVVPTSSDVREPESAPSTWGRIRSLYQ